jgi:hypothetical protein
MRTFSLALCLLLSAVVSYVFYLDHKLAPFMNAPGIHLQANSFTPVSVAKGRRINLGYASFSIPESIHGDPVNIDSDGIVGIGQHAHYALVFYPPQNSHSADLGPLLQETSALIGKPVKNEFELKMLELAQQPLSIWQLVGMGQRKAAACAALILLKSIDVSNVTSVRILESDRLGLIIRNRADFTSVSITDLKSGISQGIIITSLVKDPDEVISAIASDYDVHLTETDIDVVNRLIEGAGIKVVTSSTTSDQSPGSTSATQEPFDGQRVVKGIEAEIIKRKAEQAKEGEGSGLSQPSSP